MTLRTAHRLLNEAIAQNAEADAQLTAEINATIDQGLRRLQGVLRQQYSSLQNAGTLQINEGVIMATLGDALVLLPLAQRRQWQQRYEELTAAALLLGTDAGTETALALDGETVRPGTQDNPDESDSARRLYNHIENLRTEAIAAIIAGLQQNQSVARVNSTIAVQAGKKKGRIEAIAATRNHNALIAGTTAAMLLMRTQSEYDIWNVSFSERTCGYCLARDGNVYKRGDAFIPAHARCRCFFTAYHPKWDDPVFRRENHERSLAALEEAGRSPNYGATSFEKNAGLEAPKPYLRAIV